MKVLVAQGLLVETLRLRRRPDWLAALAAGFAAGVVMFVPIALSFRSTADLWVLARRDAAILLGPGVLPPPATLDLAILVTAALMHFSLSAVYALVLADAVYRMQTRAAILAGGAYGVILYAINYHAFTLLFPWFAAQRGWEMALAHAVYGGAAAYFYARFERGAVHEVGI